MERPVIRQIKDSLAEKRRNIDGLLETVPPVEPAPCLECVSSDDMQPHLEVIDTTLQRAENETLGICEVCQGSVETSLLEMDYTATVCLDCLSDDERQSLQVELDLSQVLHRALLPLEVPVIPGLDVAVFSRPAQIVGGDYFDFIACAGGAQALVIADIVGHGLSAGMLMSSLQATLRTMLPDSASPGEVLERINHFYLHNVNLTTFISAFLGKFDPVTRTLTYFNAGHNPPIVHNRRNGTISWLRPTGAAIGILEEYQVRAATVKLDVDDVLVLYTDGVTEAANPQGVHFGSQQLAGLVRANAGLGAAELLAALRQGLNEYIGAHVLVDDTTLIVCKAAA